jgi:hypothetical protein
VNTSYPKEVRETIVADLRIAADALDVASTLLGEHFDGDDGDVAKIDVEITCALACTFAAISALSGRVLDGRVAS